MSAVDHCLDSGAGTGLYKGPLACPPGFLTSVRTAAPGPAIKDTYFLCLVNEKSFSFI